MRRGVLLLSTLLIALAVAPVAGANRPTREVIPSPPDQVFNDCGFPVLGHIEGVEIKMTFTDHAGNPVKQLSIFPNNRLTLTNLDSGTSITVVSNGSFHLRAERDGSVSVDINGHGPVPADFAGGELGLWYLDGGHASASFDEEGNLTSIGVTGSVVNLCDRLG
jgi:hypothetical protein